MSSVEIPKREPVFDRFTRFKGRVPTNFIVDFIGCKIRESIFHDELSQHRTSEEIDTEWPEFDEEYYEWVDLLDAVVLAKDRFTMLELGAGFGRWAIRGALAARLCGITDVKLGLVEAEPLHLDFMTAFLEDNDIPREIVDVYPGTISEDAGDVLFQVKKHVESTADHPKEWYGQAKAPPDWQPANVIPGGYYGRNLFVYPWGQGAIKVPQFAAAKLFRTYDKIDLVDLDVQGEEFIVLYGGIEELNKRAKRLHIGTHGADIEANLREMLTANRWVCLRDYACGATVETPVGKIYFQDGIQTWINPRLD
ncbi:MAG: hypothetical protein ACRENA_04960 [Vulcanimicrobiaceae bacterium]